MTELEIAEIRLRFAGYDMAKARKSIGGIIITETASGNLDVTYSPITKNYFVSNMNTGRLLHEGNAKSTKIFIAAQYIITIK